MNTPLPEPIDDLILALRNVSAPPENIAVRPVRSRRLLPYLTPALAGMGALVAAIALRPQAALASSWDQVVARSAAMTPGHIQGYEPGGQLTFELWRSGIRRANWYAPSWAHRVILEERSDGQRSYRFYETISASRIPRSANYRDVGTLRSKIEPSAMVEPLFAPDLETFARVVDANVTEVHEGKRISYRVRQKKAHRVYSSPTVWRSVQSTYLVRTDDRQRITETIADDGRRTVYNYPDKIPSKVFEPRPQTRIVPFIDVSATKRIAAERIRSGFGTHRGVTLRLLALDHYGNVWILWTGAPPSGALTRKAKIIGIPTHGAFGPQELTTLYRKTRRGRPVASIGKRMEGHAVTPTVKIGGRLTVEVPARRGTAVFRNVPVLQITTLEDLNSELGLGGPRNAGK